MSRTHWLLVGMAFVWGNGCSCSENAGQGNDDQGIGNPDVPDGFGGDAFGGSFIVMPAEVTLDCTVGGAAPSQAYTAHALGGNDVTAQASWSVDDPTLG